MTRQERFERANKERDWLSERRRLLSQNWSDALARDSYLADFQVTATLPLTYQISLQASPLVWAAQCRIWNLCLNQAALQEMLVDLLVVTDETLRWVLVQDLSKMPNTIFHSDKEGKERMQLLLAGFNVLRNSHADWPQEWDKPNILNIVSLLQTYPSDPKYQTNYKARAAKVIVKCGLLLVEIAR